MLTKEDILDFLKQNKIYLQNKFHITKIGLFGSYARNQQNEKSDIDIMIELEAETQNIFEIKQELKEYIIKNFEKEVDISREKYLKPYIKEYILKEVLYV